MPEKMSKFPVRPATVDEVPNHPVGVSRPTGHIDDTGPECSVSTLNRDREFDEIAGDWDNLLTDSDGTIYQTFEWQRTWWKYHSVGRDLQILLIREKEKLIGIFPFCRRRKKLLGIPLARHIEFIGVGLSDYLAPIILRGMEHRAMSAFFEHLKRTRGEWDVLDLEDISDEMQVFTLIPEYMKRTGFPVYMYQGNVCPKISLPGLGEIGTKAFSSSGHNVKRKFKRIRTTFDTRVELIRDETQDIEKAIEDFSGLHGRRWKGFGFPSAFDDPAHRAFHVEVCTKFARRDWLRIFFMAVNGTKVATSFGFNFRSVIYMYQSNADGAEEVMKCSPGTLIRAVAMENGIREGMRVFDFMRGDETYKYTEGASIETKNYLIRASSTR